MTDDQIAELRRLNAKASKKWTADVGTIHAAEISDIIGADELRLLVDEGLQSDVIVAVAARNALPRLLEERKRLLEALKAQGRDYDDTAAAMRHDAIVFAEEPAT